MQVIEHPNSLQFPRYGCNWPLCPHSATVPTFRSMLVELCRRSWNAPDSNFFSHTQSPCPQYKWVNEKSNPLAKVKTRKGGLYPNFEVQVGCKLHDSGLSLSRIWPRTRDARPLGTGWGRVWTWIGTSLALNEEPKHEYYILWVPTRVPLWLSWPTFFFMSSPFSWILCTIFFVEASTSSRCCLHSYSMQPQLLFNLCNHVHHIKECFSVVTSSWWQVAIWDSEPGCNSCHHR